ncbi:hypothetical protein BAE44_0001862, partial [Dichanthelium oligosanthes]
LKHWLPHPVRCHRLHHYAPGSLAWELWGFRRAEPPAQHVRAVVPAILTLPAVCLARLLKQ